MAVGLFIVGLAIAAAGWRDVVAARDRLVVARTTLSEAVAQPSALQTPSSRAALIQQIGLAGDSVATARLILDGSFALKVARFVPFASQQRSGLLNLVVDSGSALDAGRTLLTRIDALATKGKVVNAQIPIDAVATFHSDLQAAASAIVPLRRSAAGLIGPLAKARRDFDALVSSTGARLLNDAQNLDVAQALIGAGGPRHYFVAVENAAEERDQGSVLSFALVNFDHGHVVVGQHGSILNPLQLPGQAPASLILKSPAPVPVPDGTAAIFGSILPTQLWQSVNATADFSFSGHAMQAMFRQATGQTVDGVIGLDVPALSALLTVVGPVTVPGISQPVTADNASTLLMHDFYSAFPNGQDAARHEVLSEVVDQVVRRLSAGTLDPVPVALNLASASAGGHIQVWSAAPAEEAHLLHSGLGGSPGSISANRTFHLAVENRNATKMDYYIKPDVQQDVTVTADGTATVRTTVTVRNTAPLNAAPSAQLGPDGYGSTRPGEYWAWVLFWGPDHSYQAGSVPESGLRLNATILDRIYAGESRQVAYDTVIRNAVRGDGTLDLRYVPQPRLTPPTLAVTLHANGWTIEGNPTWSGPWSRSMTLTWRLHR